MAMGAVDGVLAFLAGQTQHRFATGTFLKHMGFAERPFVSQQTALSPYGNDICRILSYKGKVFGVEPPTFVVLEVTKTEPGIKGNTATNTLKPATVETGAEIRVPLFINEGDKIRVDTRTCEYMERA